VFADIDGALLYKVLEPFAFCKVPKSVFAQLLKSHVCSYDNIIFLPGC